MKDIQIGGTHYKDMPIQPIEYFLANSTVDEIYGAMRKDILKYTWRDKSNKLEDAKKAHHLLGLYIEELEKR